MAALSENEKALRRRLTAWLRYFRSYYDAEDRTDARFAKRIDWSPQAISEYFSGAREGPGLDILPKLRDRVHADLNKIIERDPTPDELTTARHAAASNNPPVARRQKTARGD
jgi:transcriptional regulator with XRE-family HTH domain